MRRLSPLILGLSILLASCRGRDCAGRPADGFNLHGTFVGTQLGDYFHWQMRDACDNLRDFFILEPSRAVLAVVTDPPKFTGRRCSIAWKQTDFAVPEEGGRVHRIDEIRDVLWDADR